MRDVTARGSVAARNGILPVFGFGQNDPKAILGALAEAVSDLINDAELVKANPNEFSITPELAIRMGPYFRGWRVSPEWTRREEEEKRVAWDDEAGIRHLKKIRPDIIVHHMHQQDENLLVVEAKRIQNTSYDDDIRKLTLMTLDHSVDEDFHYGYVVGVHLVMDLPNRRVVSNDVYSLGKVDNELTAWFSTVVAEMVRQKTPA